MEVLTMGRPDAMASRIFNRMPPPTVNGTM